MHRFYTRYLFLLLHFSHLLNAQAPKFEFRGVWVATVANIDWPSSPDTPTAQQITEIKQIVENHYKTGLNAIILQVRPTGDAFFPSVHEPWSKYLTGTQGKPPYPYYNPLQTWIDECHKRGMEFHAWINPFRISQDTTEQLSATHPAVKHPDWMVSYGGKRYYDPGIPEVRAHIKKIVKEIVYKYDIDGIHMDDYFYPYPVQGIDFPDSISFAKYGSGSIADWRRKNVNTTVESLYHTIKDIKPWVRFGISPFGVWRNRIDDPLGSDTQAGITNYDNLYADVLLWLKNGWIDYVTPQLYWRHSHPKVGFKLLAQWWNDNSFGKDVYIGHAIYKIKNSHEDWNAPSQVPLQIQITRELPNIKGSIFFSSKHFQRDLLGLQDTLKNQYYISPALTLNGNSQNNKNTIIPNKIKRRGSKIRWAPYADRKHLKGFILYYWPEDEMPNLNDPSHIYSITTSNRIKLNKEKLNKNHKRYVFAITSIDKYNCESSTSEPFIIKR